MKQIAESSQIRHNIQMSHIEIIFIATSLAMDASTVCLAAAAAGFAKDARAVFRLCFHFGLFQFLMPVIGWFLGQTIISYIGTIDKWIAFLLLAGIGGRMIYDALNPTPDTRKKDPSRGLTMVMLSIATSIDALAAGFSLAMLKIDIWYPGIMIGLITSGLSLIAIKIGTRLGEQFGSRMEIAGGLILIAIGIKIVLL